MNRSGSPLPLARRLVAAFAVVAALVAGLFTLQTAAGPREAEAASAVGGPITRAEIIARAKYWYDRGDTWYSQDQADAISDGTGGKYRPDCSGLVAMAWHLPKKSDGWDLNTDDFESYAHKSWVDLDDLLPGDALLRNGHIELFEKWVNPGDHRDGAWVYSENDYGQKTNHNINPWSEMETYRGIRYDKIVEGSPVSDGGADFDGNGVGDIYATGDGSLTIWNGKGSNNFASPQVVGGGWSEFGRPAVGDFNKDGKSDLAAVKSGALHVWNGRGGNGFGAAQVIGNGWGGFSAPIAGDFNGDGVSDLASVKDGTLYVWNGKGSNNFGAAQVIGGGWSPFGAPIAGDFNNDGKSDLAAVKDGSTLHIWNGRGGNEFGAAQVIGSGWGDYDSTLMSLGDINKDGHTDIASVKEGTGTLYVWNGEGGNKFATATAIGNGWSTYF
ncbi:VCBS repeat-containing protein [Amycolatopsis sp. YIM 10]|uniref:FG-GAP repeat domain-containing protein n=1 Tax=Amycolatopsis sp. YIM 10 TaxID=2653857 RepID=UPI00129007B4|nr:VCBS repeat-containing protein [Amycolatopsis sp. YIM 10]QFU91922.1 FG-GAP repeat protein [Amycolatopsis sp. YIM 10]